MTSASYRQRSCRSKRMDARIIAMQARRYSFQLGAFFLAASSLAGCGIGKEIADNVVIHPLQWNRYSDAIGRHLRDKSLAEEAWDEVCSRDGDVYSRHYRRGFFDGFNDYLDKGGTGDPPVAPPRGYWRVYFQNAEGHQAIQDWFDGFRHGSSIAQASGVRDFVVIPLSSLPPREILTDEPPMPDPSQEKAGVTKPPVDQKEQMGPFPEQLPNKPNEKEGPVKPPPPIPPKTANGKPMPPPAPLIQVERMIAPPVPNKPKNP